MTSSLTPAGSTRAWRGTREAWRPLLPVICWRCGRPVFDDPPGHEGPSRWHLGHVVDRARGGGDDVLAPEHARCSEQAGGRLGAARLAATRRSGRDAPSRRRRIPRAVRPLRVVEPREPGPSREW